MGKFKQRSIYRETYRKGAIVLRDEFLPVLRHTAENGKPFQAIGCEVMAAGVVQAADGTHVEYQDLRVLLKPSGTN